MKIHHIPLPFLSLCVHVRFIKNNIVKINMQYKYFTHTFLKNILENKLKQTFKNKIRNYLQYILIYQYALITRVNHFDTFDDLCPFPPM